MPVLALSMTAELAVGAHLLRRPRRTAVPPATEPLPLALPAPRLSWSVPGDDVAPSAPAATACVPDEGAACVRGRVQLSPEASAEWRRRRAVAGEATPQLFLSEIAISDENDSDENDSEPGSTTVAGDGRFELQLSPGVHALTATSNDGELVAWLDDVRVQAGQSLDVVLPLEPAQAISGVLHTRLGATLDGMVTVRKPGTSREMSLQTDDEGRFTARGLPQGSYDVHVETALRPRTLRSVTAPSQLSVDIERVPVVSGKVGRGAGCGDTRALEASRGDRHLGLLWVRSDCSFARALAAEPGDLELTATRGDRVVRYTVYVPESGDPPPVCLDGPCDGAPRVLVLMARPEVFDESAATVWLSPNGVASRAYSLDGSTGITVAHLGTPEPLHILAASRTHLGQTSVTPGPGVTEVVLPMVRASLEQIEAGLLAAKGKPAED